MYVTELTIPISICSVCRTSILCGKEVWGASAWFGAHW